MEKHGGDSDAKRKPLQNEYDDFQPSPLPVNPQTAAPIASSLVQAPAAPAFTEENAICCRGPCQYFWRLESIGPDGGVSGMRQHSYVCIRNPGMETDLGDDCVFDCNQWDPMDPTEKKSRDLRREHYWQTQTWKDTDEH